MSVDNIVYSLKPAIYRGFRFELEKGNKYCKELLYDYTYSYRGKRCML